MNVVEGKHRLTFAGYCLIARRLQSLHPESVPSKAQTKKYSIWSQTVFGWPFFVLQWNMMARSASVSGVMLEHITWEEDCLIITTPQHKGDQEGAKVVPKHIYANPTDPSICPVLALGLFIFSRSFKYDRNSTVEEKKMNYPLFEGYKQEQRFCFFSSIQTMAMGRENAHGTGGMAYS
jgi:hypothetical protein